MNQDFITVVSGLPRSGTSLMMQMLAAGGYPILTDNIRTPDESNPRGYLEFEAVKRLRTDQSWLTQAAGKAVKIIHLLLRELPVDGRFAYRVIFMKRPIDEVLASQRAMLEREGKEAADETILARVFEGQLAQLNSWLSGHSCFKVLYLDYRRVLDAPRPSANLIDDFLQAGLETEAMAGWLIGLSTGSGPGGWCKEMNENTASASRRWFVFEILEFSWCYKRSGQTRKWTNHSIVAAQRDLISLRQYPAHAGTKFG